MEVQKIEFNKLYLSLSVIKNYKKVLKYYGN